MRRRKFYGNRAKPDMGWVVGHTQVNFNRDGGAGDQNTQVIELFDFADVDPEALTGRIEADKSDWFIKRMILNLYAVAQLDGLNQSDTMRLCSWGCATMGAADATDTGTGDLAVFGPEWYNRCARILQTGTLPVYHPGFLPYGVGNPSNNIGVLNVNGDEIPANGGAEPVGWGPLAPYWGPSHAVIDVPVSSAGLRNNQVVAFVVSTMDFPGWSWQEGDNLRVKVGYQFLMQKRKG